MILAKFSTFVLHHLPAVDKTGPMWIQGAMHLILICYFAATNQSEAIREKLRALEIHPQKYLYTFITSNNSVYIKLMIPWIRQSSRRTIKQNTNVISAVHLLALLVERIIVVLKSNNAKPDSLYKLNRLFESGQNLHCPTRASLLWLFGALTITNTHGFMNIF